MNRETKFGLITGLVLIVAIGMLVSRYLSTGRSHVINTPALKNVGENFRQQVLAPAGTVTIPPALSSQQPTQNAKSASVSPIVEILPGTGHAPQTQVGGSGASTVQTSGPGQTSPVQAPSVSQTMLVSTSGMIVQSQPTATGNAPASGLLENSSSVGQQFSTSAEKQYRVMSGDTLWRIAKKFYHRADSTSVMRIVRANPGILSSTKSMLRVGEKLKIPAIASQGGIELPQMDAVSDATMPIPGQLTLGTTHQARLSNKMNFLGRSTKSEKNYRVRSGDTLYAIARKTLGTASHSAIARIMQENHIHSARDLRVGEILHIHR